MSELSYCGHGGPAARRATASALQDPFFLTLLLLRAGIIMLVSTPNRRDIYARLFNDGVLVARKDFAAKEHQELRHVRNIEVIKTCQSLRSQGFVREQFSWQHYYFFLTDEGIEYLRKWLNLPADVVPKTLQAKAEPPRVIGGFRGDRSGPYRRPGATGGRFFGERRAPGGFQPEFRGREGGSRSFGRGGGSGMAGREAYRPPRSEHPAGGAAES
jgi:small subunit ribosomal protein S10e